MRMHAYATGQAHAACSGANFHIPFKISAFFRRFYYINKQERSKTMKPLRILGVIAVAGALLTGCASVAHVERDETVNFSNYKTYAWTADAEQGSKSENDLAERKIQTAINAELAKQGWREVKHNPDVLVSYDVLVERSEKQQNNPVYSRPYMRPFFNPYTRRWATLYYPSQFLGYDNGMRSVREGTLTVTMTDAKTDKMVWQGWTTDEVNSKNLTAKEIQASVKSIFRKFDVAKR
jgi:hypothetical protein